jgi:hypothetical protein
MSQRNGTQPRLQKCAGCSPTNLCDYCRAEWQRDKEGRRQRDLERKQRDDTQNSSPSSKPAQTPPGNESLSTESLSTEYHVPDYLRAVWAAAQQMEPPAIAARYILPGVRNLVLLCYALQQAAGNDSTWFLSCRHAAELIVAPFSTVSRWLGKLEHDGVLARVSTGTVGQSPGARANEYQYRG